MFDQIANWITSAQGALSAILALILFAIAAYWQVMAALKKNNTEIEKNGAEAKLKDIAAGAITSAETGEGKAIRDLITQKVIPGLTTAKVKELSSDEKHELATAVTKAKGKTLIEKMGAAFDVGLFVKDVYQSIKPMIKNLRKK